MFSTFPNLEQINLENNPVKTKNLNNLTSEQFSKLVNGIKQKKFRVISWQGTVLMDLLDYAQQLVARGNTSHNAQVVQLRKLVKQETPQKEVDAKQNEIPVQGSNTFYLVGGLMLFGLAVLAIGY